MDELEPLSDLLKAVSNLLGCGFLTDADSIEEQESEMSSAWPYCTWNANASNEGILKSRL